MKYAILVDVTECSGCERCVAACTEANGLDALRSEVDRATTRDGLSANRLSTIVQLDQGSFARKSCMHCIEPSCVSACLVGALSKTGDGPVVYDADKCIGCRYCMLACPFHIPRYEWEEKEPFVMKCDMCFDTLQSGGKPSCVEACPNQVLTFGSRDSLIRIARERIKSQPGKYMDHIWGEKEYGGTSVLYIANEDLSKLDWPDLPSVPIPHLTEPLIATTPFVGLSVASGLLGINWIIRRRMKLAANPDGESISDESNREPENHDG